MIRCHAAHPQKALLAVEVTFIPLALEGLLPYDIVAIAEAPDVESIIAFLLELGSAGNVRTTTLQAFNREEMSNILERLG